MNAFDAVAQAHVLQAESSRQMAQVMLWAIRAGFARLGNLLGRSARQA